LSGGGKFGRFPVWVLPHIRDNARTTATLVEMVCLMDYRTNRVNVTYDDLAARMGCGVSTTYRSVKTLLGIGAITKTTHQGSNSYVVVLEETVPRPTKAKNGWEDFSTIGEDLDKPQPQKPAKGRMQRLILLFTTEMRRIEPMAVSAPANGGALSKHFKEMMDVHGLTEDEVVQTINAFVMDLEMGKINRGSAPAWRLFLSRRESLMKRVTAPGGSESPFMVGGS